MTATTTHEQPRAADLEQLDDKVHALCSICDEGVAIGATFRALCGRQGLRRSHGQHEPPTNACPDCVAIPHCPRCNR